MTEKLEFGNNVGYKINDYLTKKKILDFLLNNVEEYNFNYQVINNESHLMKLKNLQYFVTPNIAGDNYLFVCKKINNIYYNVIIKKKTLGNLENINYNNIIMLSLKVRMSTSTYNGTIFDGKIVNLGGCSVFIINDAYMLYGQDLLEDNLDKRHEKVNKFLDESYIIDNNMNVVDFRLNKLNDISDIKDLVYNRMDKSVYNFDSIAFLPKVKDQKYIFYFNNKHSYIMEKNMLGKKIDVDVIELFTKDVEDDTRRVGIAHIPTTKCSKICAQHITDRLTPIKCRLNPSFKKWEPIEIYIDDNIKIDSYEDIKEIMMNVVAKEK